MITARYPGYCSACGGQYPAGTLLQRLDDPLDDGWIHADCDDPTPESVEGDTCQDCWLRHPEGECDR